MANFDINSVAETLKENAGTIATAGFLGYVAYSFLAAPTMKSKASLNIVKDNLRMAQCGRWRKKEQKLYFSDEGAKTKNDVEEAEGDISKMNEDGSERQTVASFASYGTPGKGELPAGLGFLPDGRILSTTMRNKKVVIIDPSQAPPGNFTEYADLNEYEPRRQNEMVIDDQGRAYVGGFGYDIFDKDPKNKKLANITLLEPGTDAGFKVPSKVSLATGDMNFPSGAVITPDKKMLIISESQANCLTCFDIDPTTGALSNRQIWASLPGVYINGICLDAEGCVWAAFVATELWNPIRGPLPTLAAYASAGQPVGGYIRVARGGKILETICLKDTGGHFCQLGGADGKTLFMLCSKKSKPLPVGNSFIASVKVKVGGAEREGDDAYFAGYC